MIIIYKTWKKHTWLKAYMKKAYMIIYTYTIKLTTIKYNTLYSLITDQNGLVASLTYHYEYAYVILLY